MEVNQTPSHMAVIINHSSGSKDKRKEIEQVTELFKSKNIKASISLAQSGEELVEITHRIIREGYDMVVAGGGDGTVNTVASMLVGTDKILGILPLGTLNHFAKDLKIPLDLEQAVDNLISGSIVSIDVGEVNGYIFVNNSSIGIYPYLVRHREWYRQWGWSKGIAFFWALLKVFHRYPFFNVRLITGDQEFKRVTPFVFVGNNEYEIESLNIGSRRCLNAGYLCLYVTHQTGRLGLLRLALRLLLGRLRQEKDLDKLLVKEVWVGTKRRKRRRKYVYVSVDGEIILMEMPLHYQIRPCALQVMVPKSKEELEN
jgi:diacylglycerol kinase family enzyme